jgi:sialic acid synthase SpsE
MDGGVGDTWSTGAFSFESPLKDLLDSENYTVEQLLEQDELLQELRGMHPTLLQFFSQEESVVTLIEHVIQEKAPLVVSPSTNENDDDDSRLYSQRCRNNSSNR